MGHVNESNCALLYGARALVREHWLFPLEPETRPGGYREIRSHTRQAR
jgi:hypothetical protein